MGVIAMNRSVVAALAAILLLGACNASEPPSGEVASPQPNPVDPAPAEYNADLVQPDPELVARVVRQIEASINIAADPQKFLTGARGNRLQAVLDRLAFQRPLNLSKAAHETAPEATRTAYEASVAAHDAAFRHNRLYFNSQSDVDELLSARARRDQTFHAALTAWKQFNYVPVDY